MKEFKFEELVGQTITEITGAEKDNDEILFKLADGRTAKMYHQQDCCEQVNIEDISGDISDLLNSPVLIAEESIGDRPAGAAEERDYSETWTFYRIGTIKGTVVIRWYGSSNGYYSEGVDFELI